MKKKLNLSSGQASHTLIVLSIIVALAIIIVYFGLRFAVANKAKNEAANNTPAQPAVPLPVYEGQIGDIDFIFISAKDSGSKLKSTVTYQTDLTTTERFIKVTVGAQNKGKVDFGPYTWDIGNIVDSEGRNFIPDLQAYYFLPQPNLCGAVLKPAFAATPCTKIYQVSKLSTGLKIEVMTTGQNIKDQKGLLDLKF
jgi:hypothetical protein